MNLVPGKKMDRGMQLFKTKNFIRKIKNADSYAHFKAKFFKNIKLVDGIEVIGKYAFSYCKNLKTVIIPNSVIRIEGNAFCFCTNLKEIVLPEDLEYIGKGAFLECQSLKKIIIPKNIRKILESTFNGCENLEEVILPEDLEYIGERAFFKCKKLKRIVIPKSVKKIDTEAFYICSDNLEIYDEATNARFINDINYSYDKDKTIDEIIIDLCSKYNIVKEKLLLLAIIRLWPNYCEKLNYEDEYNSLIKYVKDNFISLGKNQKRICVSLEKNNKNIYNNSTISKEQLIPWYATYNPDFIIPINTEYSDDNDVKNIEKSPKHNQNLNITDEKYEFDEKGDLWIKEENGQGNDLMPSKFKEEFKVLVKKL